MPRRQFREITRRQFMQDELCESAGLPPDCANLIIAYVGPEASLSVVRRVVRGDLMRVVSTVYVELLLRCSAAQYNTSRGENSV